MKATAKLHYSITFIEPVQLQVVHDLAHATWQITYQEILEQAQIDYMLEKVYQVSALEQQRHEGQIFLLLLLNQEPAAFASYSWLMPDKKIMKLNKLYLLPAHQGYGFGKALLEEVVRRCRALGAETLELNVHRQNPALHFYLNNGFSIYKTVDLPFGPFTLNDHMLRRQL